MASFLPWGEAAAGRGGIWRADRAGGAKGKAALAEASLLMAAFFVGTEFVSVKYALEGLPPLVPAKFVLAGLLILSLLRLGVWRFRSASQYVLVRSQI